MLSVNQLSLTRHHQLLLENISFDVHRGNLLLIEGKNGSGKTSLLKTLSGLSFSYTGQISWSMKEVYIQNLHYLGHQNGIRLKLTVLENIYLFRQLHHQGEALVIDVETVLSNLQLVNYQNIQTGLLSEGQKRRLALSKLQLALKPIWILDEPLTALDESMKQLFLLWLREHLNHQGIAIISTHSCQDFKLFQSTIITL